ncbi:MAG: hypothetical protein U0704_07650 [Candidatus Eisenbacteria bacterium]
MSHDADAPPAKFDPSSKLGRALFRLVDVSQKMSVEVRTVVVRVRNAVESSPGDPMVRFKVDGDLSWLMRDSKLNAIVRAIRKALPR